MKDKSTDFSRWWGVGANAPRHIYSTNEVGGYSLKKKVCQDTGFLKMPF
jgi:hypothetical protein